VDLRQHRRILKECSPCRSSPHIPMMPPDGRDLWYQDGIQAQPALSLQHDDPAHTDESRMGCACISTSKVAWVDGQIAGFLWWIMTRSISSTSRGLSKALVAQQMMAAQSARAWAWAEMAGLFTSAHRARAGLRAAVGCRRGEGRNPYEVENRRQGRYKSTSGGMKNGSGRSIRQRRCRWPIPISSLSNVNDSIT